MDHCKAYTKGMHDEAYGAASNRHLHAVAPARKNSKELEITKCLQVRQEVLYFSILSYN